MEGRLHRSMADVNETWSWLANRLAGATSPYLPQHQHNPVGWWPCRAEARRRDVPVLISVGHAA